MPTFTYQAKKGPAEIVSGTINANSQDEVVARLLGDGLVPVSILITAKASDVGPQIGPKKIRLRSRERRMFTKQLTSMLKAKMELVPAVSILKEQSASVPVRRLLDDMERQMRDGHPFSEAIERHPMVFPPLFLSAIRAGEAAGKLDDILIKLVEFDDQQEILEGRLKGALAYPALLLFVGVGCIGFFLWFVVPRMSSLFDQLGGALPWPTRFLINLSAGLSAHWLWVVCAIFGFAILVKRIRRSPVVIAATEKIISLIPFASDILEARQVGRFTRTLGFLLDSGLPVFQAMDVARPTVNSALMESRLQEAHETIKRGESIAYSLKSAKCFPPLVTQMIAVGEASGTLIGVLDEVSSYYERYLDETLRVSTALIEPLMIVVVGLLVGFCVLAMILPIFQMTQLVH